MSSPTVEETSLAATPLLGQSLPRIDYADAFWVPLTPAQAESVDDLTRSLFSRAPGWVEALLRLRNALVRPFGLKTEVGPAPFTSTGVLQPGGRVGIFRVFARTPEEVLLGEDDKHLDFRVSVRVERDAAAQWAIVSTVVCFNSTLGRLYFLPVRPFHKVIVPAMMRHALGS